MKYKLIVLITIAMLFGFQTRNAAAAWLDLDSSFGFLGVSIDSLTNHYPRSVAVQPDGKILVTGYRLSAGKKRFFLRRYLSNGQIDSSFGNNGSAVSNALINFNSDFEGLHIALKSNGKIAVAGTTYNSNSQTVIWQFHSNGSGDTAIGNGGMRILSDYTNYYPRSLAVQNDKLVIGITISQYTTDPYVYVLRLNNNGTLDTAFGNAGELVPTKVGSNQFSMIVENGTNKITVGSSLSPYFAPAGLERFLPDGLSDRTLAFANFNHSGFADQFIKLSNGNYAMAIVPGFYQTPDYQLLKLNSNGTQNSVVTYAPSNSNGHCPRILAQQQDGKVVVYAPDKLHRFDSNINPTTAETKSCSTYFSQYINKTRAVLQTDDKMVFAARGENGGNLLIIRTMPD